MDMKNINYAIQYIKEFHHGAEPNERNIRAVRGFPSYQVWLKVKLREDGIEEPQFEPVFTTNVTYRRPDINVWHVDEIDYNMPF